MFKKTKASNFLKKLQSMKAVKLKLYYAKNNEIRNKEVLILM